jgi:hypothetical protein
MVNLGGNSRFLGPIGPSCLSFKKMGYLIGDDNDVDDSDINVEMLDEKKMKCLIIDCAVALRRIQREKKERRNKGRN